MKLLIFLLLFPCFAWAGLDEVTISTQDKTCSMHYLSTRTKNNWYIRVDSTACTSGWVDGFAKVEVYSPTHQKTETLEGFFSQGYWLNDFRTIGPVLSRTSVHEGIQSLSFLLGKDEEADITYVGQLRSIQPEGRSYGPFQGCPDFRVMVVVPDDSVFQNEAFLDKIVTQGLAYARSYCADLDVLALFGTTSLDKAGILFQMQVDAVTEERRLIPVKPAVPEKIVKPTELRSEKTDVLMSVEQGKESPVVSYKTRPPVEEISVRRSEKKKEALRHLNILADISGKPVSGRCVVHIKNILLNGTGVTDLPEKIELLYYPGLKTGWAVIEGELTGHQMQVFNVQFCEEEWCTDVS